ncbi:hypothetical protein LTR97_004899 [Elasticomyces elasticus]|uniref:Uncharacterized protein n=1 Tax=Elasticomyces elasticus TaxID=574655 RepID=A0AAN7WDZ5_9PEZI|nr:hypothetical protein LTR97_004899 [Elasticomyces elasticus]
MRSMITQMPINRTTTPSTTNTNTQIPPLKFGMKSTRAQMRHDHPATRVTTDINREQTTVECMTNQMASLPSNLRDTQPTAPACVAHWLNKLPGELRNIVYRATYDALIADLTKRSRNGIYGPEVCGNDLLCARTHDSFSDLTIPTPVINELSQVNAQEQSQASKRHTTKLTKPCVPEAHSIWLAEYLPQIRRLCFRFTSVGDYHINHLPLVQRHGLHADSRVTVKAAPAGANQAPRGFHCHSIEPQSQTDHITDRGLHRGCSICEVLDLIERATEAHAFSRKAIDTMDMGMWWRPSLRTWWHHKLLSLQMPARQNFEIYGRDFMLDELRFDEHGHLEQMRLTGPLHLLDWARFPG